MSTIHIIKEIESQLSCFEQDKSKVSLGMQVLVLEQDICLAGT